MLLKGVIGYKQNTSNTEKESSTTETEFASCAVGNNELD
jgi:hypothetical protein